MRRLSRKSLLFSFCLFAGLCYAAPTKIAFDKNAKAFKLAEGKGYIYELSIPAEKTDNPRIGKLLIRVDEKDRITHFQIDWNKFPDDSKLKTKSMVIRRKIGANYRRLLEAMKLANPNGKNELYELVTPSDQNFKVKTTQEVVDKVGFASRAQKEELKSDWKDFYFGYSEADKDAFAKGKEKPSDIKASEILNRLQSAGATGEFNKQVLYDLQERATLTAQALKAYGAEDRADKNVLKFEDFPDSVGVQELPWPDFIEEGVQSEREKLSQGPGEFKKDFRAPKK